MALRELSRNNIFLILYVLLWGCYSKPAESISLHSSLVLNIAEQQITMQNDLLCIDKKPFSGILFTFFTDTKDTATIASYAQGKEHGVWRKFYPSGKLKEERFFKNGKKVDALIAWWENGNKQLYYFFVDDEYEGTCKEWNVEGRLVKVMNYKKGHEDGPQQWWYDNGKVKANYVIQDGRRYGLLGTKNCINVSDSVFSQ